RSRSARTVLSGVRENDAQETLSNHEGTPVSLGRAGAPDAAGEECQAGTVCRSQFSSGTREGGFLQRDGEEISGKVSGLVQSGRESQKIQKAIQRDADCLRPLSNIAHPTQLLLRAELVCKPPIICLDAWAHLIY